MVDGDIDGVGGGKPLRIGDGDLEEVIASGVDGGGGVLGGVCAVDGEGRGVAVGGEDGGPGVGRLGAAEGIGADIVPQVLAAAADGKFVWMKPVNSDVADPLTLSEDGASDPD